MSSSQTYCDGLLWNMIITSIKWNGKMLMKWTLIAVLEMKVMCSCLHIVRQQMLKTRLHHSFTQRHAEQADIIRTQVHTYSDLLLIYSSKISTFHNFPHNSTFLWLDSVILSVFLNALSYLLRHFLLATLHVLFTEKPILECILVKMLPI